MYIVSVVNHLQRNDETNIEKQSRQSVYIAAKTIGQAVYMCFRRPDKRHVVPVEVLRAADPPPPLPHFHKVTTFLKNNMELEQ